MATDTIKISSTSKDIRISDVIISGTTQEERDTRKNPLLPYRGFDYDRQGVPGGVFPWHWHDEVECFSIRYGSMYYGIPGEEVVFHAGDVGFLNSGVLHMTQGADAFPFKQQNHIFSPDLICGDRNSPLGMKYVMPLISNKSARLFRVEAADPLSEKLRGWMEEANRAREAGDPGYELTIRACMTQIWLTFLKIMPPAVERIASADGERLMAMLNWIHANYDRKVSLDEIAAAAHISAKECERCFQRQIRTLPFDYLMDYRLEKARQFLEGDHLSVTEIAMRCGFGSTSYFGACFRRKYGMSPREYRQRIFDEEKQKRQEFSS